MGTPINEIHYTFDSYKFKLQASSTYSLSLKNKFPLTIKAYQPSIIPLGVKIVKSAGYAFFLWGKSPREIFIHTGLIDGCYRGELQMIIHNVTQHNITLLKNELKINLMAFQYALPRIYDQTLLSAPQYPGDAGYDISLPGHLDINPHGETTIPLNIAFPRSIKHYKPVIVGRSGMAARGIVTTPKEVLGDSHELCLQNFTDQQISFPPGTRICQIVFLHKDNLRQPAKLSCGVVNIGDNFNFRPEHVKFVEVCTESNQTSQGGDISNPMTRLTNIRGEKGIGSTGIN
ncbi:deoxyuridine triphosphatase [Saguinine gammaherpesvirus 1]|uniref:Deoxyuridine triphosphatase n=1 Tax=Saguinine gammaherpesvirus 1 TaxID=2169901 RepID=A0A9Q8QY74_9GAMA|nr:deoxyuridine triphosphatase [Saguinine gammaherpesvirus 1]